MNLVRTGVDKRDADMGGLRAGWVDGQRAGNAFGRGVPTKVSSGTGPDEVATTTTSVTSAVIPRVTMNLLSGVLGVAKRCLNTTNG